MIDTVSREPSVARGTALEVGLRSGEAGTGLTALVLVGDCKGTCTDNDKIEMRRLLLQPAGGGWKVARSEAL
ncbi:hypothetical protein [Actinomadura madurae]|uniref:hypothetical protein n=1 Tax=Actinomadura madurae TaxID=1993 RepID=UPI0020D222EC|nr:hypothetical protein [Actinomadura madurae]MCQ0019854.1 hypothetical protein [Actinomadura madurae]